MHLLLTDRLTCPRCGPDFGLILLADHVDDRRVLEGTLGCPNCRDAFPVCDGFGDLRAPPRGELPTGRAGSPSESDPDEARRIAALLGVVGGPGTLALVGLPSRHAAQLTAASDEVQVVAIDPDLRAWPEFPRVSRLAAGPGMPFFSRTLRGVCLDGGLEAHWVEEAARVVAPGSRVAVVDAPAGVGDLLRHAGLSVLVSDAGTVVAARG